MLRALWMKPPSLVLLASLVLGPPASAQEKPKDAAPGQAQAKAAAPGHGQEGAGAAQAQARGLPPGGRRARKRPGTRSSISAARRASPLETLVARMDKAAKDSAVKAVVILLEQATVGSAQVEELRQAIARVRGAGKEVIAHADSIGSLGQYALLSAASRLSVVPTADLWITGLYGESPYLRRLLDKLGVTARFHDLRRLQERRGDVPPRGPQQGSRGHAELAARQPLRHSGETHRRQPQGQSRAGQGLDRQRPPFRREGQASWA